MKKALLAIGIVIVLILIVGTVKDFRVYFALSVLMALIVWAIKRKSGRTAKAAISLVITASVILPLAVIPLFGVIEMQKNPGNANEISSSTIGQIINFFADNILYVLLSEFAGVVAGALIKPFKWKRG